MPVFSGAGLLDYPFKQDDSFDIKFAVDFDADACETYRHNIGDHILCMDMRELKSSQVPDVDLIIGGPCCQGYSNANRAGNSTLDKTKRLLIDDYIRIVKEKKPISFIIENVNQFVTKENGLYLEKVLSGLSEYNITYSVVNDDELLGYSKRSRTILIGFIRSAGKIVIPQVSLTGRHTVKDALKKVDSTWFNYKDVTIPSEKTREKMSYVPQGGNWRDIPPEIGGYGPNTQSNIMRRLKMDEPSITLSNFRKSNILHPVQDRILTVSEAAAIMGLDKNFKFYGSLSR